MVTRSLIFLVLLAGCDREADPASAPRPAPREEVVEAPGEGLRAPRGGDDVDCSGPPDNPAQIDLFTQAAADGDLGRAISGLEALTSAHPRSSTARVRLGELMLRARPPRAAEAHAWFAQARSLHARGCALGYRDHWAALEGQALSLMMQGHYRDALEPLRESLSQWPGSRATHYNLGCALCQTGDLDGCERQLEITLGALEAPTFLADQTRPPSYYRSRLEQDPDLEPLRRDPNRLRRLLRP